MRDWDKTEKMTKEQLEIVDKMIETVVKRIVEIMGEKGMKSISRYELTMIFGRGKKRYE